MEICSDARFAGNRKLFVFISTTEPLLANYMQF
jgi:hypothetical protein